MKEVQKRIATFIAVPEEVGGYLFWGETPGGWRALCVGGVDEVRPFLDTEAALGHATEYVLVTVCPRGRIDYSAGYSTEAALAANVACGRWVKFRDDQSEQRSYVARAAAARATAARLPAAPIHAPPKTNIVVFIAVPTRRDDEHAFWFEGPGGWSVVHVGSAAFSFPALKAKTESWQGTEFVTMFLSNYKLSGGVSRIKYSAGHSGRAATVAEGAYDRWVGHRRLASPDDVPRVVTPPAPVPAPEQKKDAEKEIEPCSFCQKPAIAGNSILSTCGFHNHALALHADRMEIGLVDCPETRAETLRFTARAEADQALSLARATGFRTLADLADQTVHTELASVKAPIDPVPLVGTTPHYEWP